MKKVETVGEFIGRGGRITKVPDHENSTPEVTVKSRAGEPGVISGPGPSLGTVPDEGLCIDCPKKSSCAVLCPEALSYVEKDYVSLREKPSESDYFSQGWPNIMRPSEGIELTDIEAKIFTLVVKGKKYLEISEILNISYDSVRKHASNIRKKAEKRT